MRRMSVVSNCMLAVKQRSAAWFTYEYVAHRTHGIHGKAFMELYSQILDHGGSSFAEVLRHIRDRPGDGCLFHCTGVYLSTEC